MLQIGIFGWIGNFAGSNFYGLNWILNVEMKIMMIKKNKTMNVL